MDEVRELAYHGVEITMTVDVGEPWRAIVEYTEENDIDYIIMGVTVVTTTHRFP